LPRGRRNSSGDRSRATPWREPILDLQSRLNVQTPARSIPFGEALTPGFRSWLMGGFECSTHRRGDGVRLDLLASTRHDVLALRDYEQLARLGIHTVRDGVRWHRVESAPDRRDWSEFVAMLRAAAATGTQVIWDLFHYGWPDHVDVWANDFPTRFAAFAREAALRVAEESDETPLYCPLNEISYFAWAGGEVGRMNPFAVGRGAELKRQLVRAWVAAVDSVRSVDPRARFLTAEPLIHVAARSDDPPDDGAAARLHEAQFEALDLLTGLQEPELGGRPDCVDLVGANFYPDNQWVFGGPTIPFGHHAYRPLSQLLVDLHRRHSRPILIAETGAEGVARPYWLHHVCGEVRAAGARGVPIEGICLYPVLDYPGWDDDRACQVGLLSCPDAAGRRRPCTPLVEELRRQQTLHAAATALQPRVALGHG
jgi:hypothetical protein